MERGIPAVQSNGLCRFFPEDRVLFFHRSEAELLLRSTLQPLMDGLHALDQINKNSGWMRVLFTDDGITVADMGFGTIHQPYDQIADGKWALGVDAGADGFSTRIAQLVKTLRLRGYHVVHFGSYEEDGLGVFFSGVQPWWDEKIAKIAWSLVAGLNDTRKDMLEQVRRALGLSWYWQAMNAIEEVAARFCYDSIAEAVKRIVQDATLRRAQEILNERWQSDRKSIRPGIDPEGTVPNDSTRIALSGAYGPPNTERGPGDV